MSPFLFGFYFRALACTAALALAFSAQAHTSDEAPFITRPDSVSLTAQVPEKAVVPENSSKVQVSAAPARVDGLWCAVGLIKGASIRLVQKHQTFTGVLAWRERTRGVSGTINGSELRVPAGNSGELVLQAVGDTMRITSAQGGMVLAQGQTFNRTTGASCS